MIITKRELQQLSLIISLDDLLLEKCEEKLMFSRSAQEPAPSITLLQKIIIVPDHKSNDQEPSILAQHLPLRLTQEFH